MDEQMMRKYNLKLYAVYKMFSWDLLFYYAIIFLFLTKVKGLSISSILLAEAFYPFFKMIFQLVCISVIDRLGKRSSLLLGNLLISFSVLVLILGKGLPIVFISNFIMAMGFVLKDLCEPTLLDDSIPETIRKPDTFSKIDGRGSTYFYYLDAITSMTTGFLFVINGYLPMICCLLFSLIATVISYNLNDIPDPDTKKASLKEHSGSKALKAYIRELKESFKYIFKSSRLKGLIMIAAIFHAILTLFPTIRSSLLLTLGTPEQYFGIIVAARPNYSWNFN